MAVSSSALRVRYDNTPPVAPQKERLAAAVAAAEKGDLKLAFRHCRQLLTTISDTGSEDAIEAAALTAHIWPLLLESAPEDSAHGGMRRILSMRPPIAGLLLAALDHLQVLTPGLALAVAFVLLAQDKAGDAAGILVNLTAPDGASPAFCALVEGTCNTVMAILEAEQSRGWAAGKSLPYPILADGRPRFETVWLEVTSWCNQKCTFCPDPARESKRNHIAVDRFKQMVDELAADFHVGHMELNAYGEALLHPKLGEMLAYLREKKVPWPTYFTTHGLTLLDSKIDMLDQLHPTGIAVSLHNDSQESYAATRSAKIGNYQLLVERVTALLERFVQNRRGCSVRLYLMIRNGKEWDGVPAEVLNAFTNDWRKFAQTIRFWEDVVAGFGAGEDVVYPKNSDETIKAIFDAADQGTWDKNIELVQWKDEHGNWQHIFITPRPTSTYANLIPAMHDGWQVTPAALSHQTCSFTDAPSLAIFASGALGICCIDLEATASFGNLADFKDLKDAVSSPACKGFFTELANGVASCKGCQTCLGSVKRK